MSHNKLVYLLQHRGYTHTVVGCVALALLLYVGAECWLRWKHLTPTRGDRLALAGMALFGTMLHLAMDALNSYGVHPFWPLQNRWFYGDSVFIVEPLYWIATAPLFFVMRSKLARLVIALALLAALGVSGGLNLVPRLWCVGFAVLTGALLAVGARASARAAALTSAAIMVLVTGVFLFAGRLAAQRVDSIAALRFPADNMIDHVLTSMPMNPVCWDVLLLETHADRYAIRHAVVSSAPQWVPAQKCPTTTVPQRTTAPMVEVAAPNSPDVHWLGEFSMSRTQLIALVAADCDAAALMRFARAPFATRLERQWILGDLRFDREPQLGMAEIALGANPGSTCPRTVPWTQPRADLLR